MPPRMRSSLLMIPLFVIPLANAVDLSPTFEKAWRKGAMTFAHKIKPTMSAGNLDLLAQGLNTTDPDPPGTAMLSAAQSIQGNFYIAATPPCSDTGNGSQATPFCSVIKGVSACRGKSPCIIVLGAGTHRLNQTITLTPENSGLAVVGLAGAIISGTQPVTTEWEPASEIPTRNANVTVWKTLIPGDLEALDTLLVDGKRAIPARYPNADPEIDKYPIGYVTGHSQTWMKPAKVALPTYIQYNDSSTFRDSYRSLFQDYRGGVGGACSHYTPPFSYWCAETPQGGGASQYTVPSGLVVNNQTLPNGPYKSVAGAMVTAWRLGHWANWGFEIGSQEPLSDGKTAFNFSRGGFQGGRGHKHGAEWFVLNVQEELDFPREYWYDAKMKTLYFASGTANIDCHGQSPCETTRTQPSPKTSAFELATLKTLFEVQGSQAHPVVNVTFRSLTFTGTSTTFLDPHGVPSGGDWALQRSAAMFFEGTEGAKIEDCSLVRLDGNAVMLSGYNQHASVSNNTFYSTGASAIALWGYSNGTHSAQPEGTGPDGTQGNFPRYTLVEGNFFRYLGVHEKQSSCFFQAKSAQTTLRRNICFDVPRAGFNINDGFGGGNDISENLLFQTCGESGDHGAINTWDRQSFITTVATGQPSVVPARSSIHHNFIVSDYDANGGMIDNDDGSAFYDEYNNFGVYGGAKMGNIDGHGKVSHSNVFAFAHVYGTSCFWNWQGWFPLAGYEEQFYNNTCIMGSGGTQNYISMPKTCDFGNTSSIGIHVHSNRVLAPGGNASITGCGKTIPFSDWSRLGIDPGSTIGDLPADEEIVDMGLMALGVQQQSMIYVTV